MQTFDFLLRQRTRGLYNLHRVQEKEDVLDEIIIKKTLYDDNWKYNLTRFKREFIGITKLALPKVILIMAENKVR